MNRLCVYILTLVIGMSTMNVMSCAHAQDDPVTTSDAKAEWQILNEKSVETYNKGHFDAGLTAAQAALNLADTAFGKASPDTLSSVNNLGMLYQSQGLYVQAEPLYLRALEGRERVLGKDHPDTLISVNNLGALYNAQGLYAQAEPLYLRALEARKRVLGKDHPDTLISVNNLGYLYQVQGLYTQAESLYLRALEGLERVLGKDHPSTLGSVNNLGVLYQVQGLYTQAEPLYLRALEGNERVLGKDHPDTLLSVNNLGALYQVQGLYAQAEPLYLRALEGSERVLGKDHPDTLDSVNNLGTLYQSQGLYAQAEPLFLRAIIDAERVLGEYHISLVAYRGNYANLLAEHLEAGPAAIYYLKRAVNILQVVRANLSELQDTTQAAFLEKNKSYYTQLQEWLIEAGRFAEAEQVGRMLKEQEYFEYLQQRAVGEDPRGSRVGLSAREAEWRAQIQAIAARPNEIAAQRDLLLAKEAALSGEQMEQLSALNIAYDAAYRDYRDSLKAWRVEVSALSDESLAAEARAINEALQANNSRKVAALGDDVAILNIVPLQDELHFFLTTPFAFVHESIKIDRTDLFADIGRAREAILLDGAKRAGGPVAQLANTEVIDSELQALLSQLHRKLIAPIEPHLDDARTGTLILNLQDALRYAPMAALYDAGAEDRNYLTERYRLVLYTPQGLGDRSEVTGAKSALGFGVSLAHPDFGALPAVKAEMEAIFHGADGVGVFSGAAALDADFTRSALADGLSEGPKIVHIASHFRLRPGNTDASFLLLGDGSHLSLTEFSRSFDLRFDGVNILTLSACSTALGGTGAEIDSFGALAQDLGAESVIATLWNVADDATADLMSSFYEAYVNDSVQRAEALRLAQVEMIHSDDRSHPYYWAPFILMGDWR